MPDPILDRLGPLVGKTRDMAKSAPRGGYATDGPDLAPEDLRNLVVPPGVNPSQFSPVPYEPPAQKVPAQEPVRIPQQDLIQPQISPEEMAAARSFSDFSPEMQQQELNLQRGIEPGAWSGFKRGLEQIAPSLGKVPGMLGDAPDIPRGSPLRPGSLQHRVDADDEVEGLREKLQEETVATGSTINVGLERAQRELEEKEDKLGTALGITQKPVEAWSKEEEERLRQIIGPEFVKRWAESEYEQSFTDLGGDESKVFRTRRQLKRALYFSQNPFAQAMAMRVDLPTLFRSNNSDLEEYSNAAHDVRTLMEDESLPDIQRVDRIRKRLADFYGGVRDANGVQRGRNLALEMLKTPEDVIEQAQALLTTHAVDAETELGDRRVAFVTSGLGIGNIVDAKRFDPSMLAAAGALTVPPESTMARIYRARYQIDDSISDEEIRTTHKGFRHVARLYERYRMVKGDKIQRMSIAKNILEQWKSYYTLPVSMDVSSFSAANVLQLFNFSIPMPASAWDGVTWELNGRPVAPMADERFFELQTHLQEKKRDAVRNKSGFAWMTEREIQSIMNSEEFDPEKYAARESGFDKTRVFAGEGVARNIDDEIAETFIYDYIPIGAQRRLAATPFDHWLRYVPLLGWMLPSVKEMKEGVTVGDMSDWGATQMVQLQMKTPGTGNKGMLTENDLLMQRDIQADFTGKFDRLFDAAYVKRELAASVPNIPTWGSALKRMMSDADVRDGTARERALMTRYALGMNAKDISSDAVLGLFSFEKLKAESLMWRSAAFQVVHLFGKLGLEGMQNTSRQLSAVVKDNIIVPRHKRLAEEAEAEGNMMLAGQHLQAAEEAAAAGRADLKAYNDDMKALRDGASAVLDHYADVFTKTGYAERYLKTQTTMALLDLYGASTVLGMARRGATQAAAKSLRGASKLPAAWKALNIQASELVGTAAKTLETAGSTVVTLKPLPNFRSASVKKKPIRRGDRLKQISQGRPVRETLKKVDAKIAEELGVEGRVLAKGAPKERAKRARETEIAQSVENRAAESRVLLEDILRNELDVLGMRKPKKELEVGKDTFKPEVREDVKFDFSNLEWTKKEKWSDWLDPEKVFPRPGTKKVEAEVQLIPNDLVEAAHFIENHPFLGAYEPLATTAVKGVWNSMKGHAAAATPFGRAFGAMVLSRQEQMGPAFKHVIEEGRGRVNGHLEIGVENTLKALATVQAVETTAGLKQMLEFVADAFNVTADADMSGHSFRMSGKLADEMAPLAKDLRGSELIEVLFGEGAELVFSKKDMKAQLKKADPEAQTEMFIRHKLPGKAKREDGLVSVGEVAEALGTYLETSTQMLVNSYTFRELVLNPDGAYAKKFFEDTTKLGGLLERGWERADEGGIAIGRTAAEEIARLRQRLKDNPTLMRMIASPRALKVLGSGTGRRFLAKMRDALDEKNSYYPTNVTGRLHAGGEVHHVPLDTLAEVLAGDQAASMADRLFAKAIGGGELRPEDFTLEFTNPLSKKVVKVNAEDMGLLEDIGGGVWAPTKRWDELVNEREAAYSITMDDITNETMAGRVSWLATAADSAAVASDNGVFVVTRKPKDWQQKSRYSPTEKLTEIHMPSMTVHNRMKFGTTQKSVFIGNEAVDATKRLRMDLEPEPVFYDRIPDGAEHGETATAFAAWFGGEFVGTRRMRGEAHNAADFLRLDSDRPAFYAQELSDGRFVYKWANGDRAGKIVTGDEMAGAYLDLITGKRFAQAKSDIYKGRKVDDALFEAHEALTKRGSLVDHAERFLKATIAQAYKDAKKLGATDTEIKKRLKDKYGSLDRRRGIVQAEIDRALSDLGLMPEHTVKDQVFRISYKDEVGSRLWKIAKGDKKAIEESKIKVTGARTDTPHVAYDLAEHPLGKVLYGDPRNAARAVEQSNRVVSGRNDAVDNTWMPDGAEERIVAAAKAAGQTASSVREHRSFFNLSTANANPVAAIKKGFASMDGQAAHGLTYLLKHGELPVGLLRGKYGEQIYRQWENAGFWKGGAEGKLTDFGLAARMMNPHISRQTYQTMFARAAMDASNAGRLNKFFNMTNLLGDDHKGIMHALEPLNSDVRGSLSHAIAKHYNSGLYAGKEQVAADMFKYWHRSYVDTFLKTASEADPSSGLGMETVLKRKAKDFVVRQDPTTLALEPLAADNFYTAAAITRHIIQYRMERLELLHQLIRDGHVVPAQQVLLKFDPNERIEQLKQAGVAEDSDQIKLLRERASRQAETKKLTEEPQQLYMAPGKERDWTRLNVADLGIDDQAGALVFGEIWGGDAWYIRKTAGEALRYTAEEFGNHSGWKLERRAKTKEEATQAAAKKKVERDTTRTAAEVARGLPEVDYATRAGQWARQSWAGSWNLWADFVETVGDLGDTVTQKAEPVRRMKTAKLFHAYTAPTIRNAISNVMLLALTEPGVLLSREFVADLWDYAVRVRPGGPDLEEVDRAFYETGLGGHAAAKSTERAGSFALPTTAEVSDYYGRRTAEVTKKYAQSVEEVMLETLEATSPEVVYGKGVDKTRIDPGGRKKEFMESPDEAERTFTAMRMGNEVMSTFMKAIMRLKNDEFVGLNKALGNKSIKGMWHFMNDFAAHTFGGVFGSKTRLVEMDRFSRASANLFGLADEAFKYALFKHIWKTRGPGAAKASSKGGFSNLGVHGGGTFKEWYDAPEVWRSSERQAYKRAKFLTPAEIKGSMENILPDYTFANAPTRALRGFAEPFVFFQAKVGGIQAYHASRKPLLFSMLARAGAYQWANQLDTPEEMSILYTHSPESLPWTITQPNTAYSYKYMDMTYDPISFFQFDQWIPLKMTEAVWNTLAKDSNHWERLAYSAPYEVRVAEALRTLSNVMYGSGQINPYEVLYRRLVGLGADKYGIGKHEHAERAYTTDGWAKARNLDERATASLKQREPGVVKKVMDQVARMGIEGGGAHLRRFGAAHFGTPYHSSAWSKGMTDMDMAKAIMSAFFGVSQQNLEEPRKIVTGIKGSLDAQRRIEKQAQTGDLSKSQMLFMLDNGTLPAEEYVKIAAAAEEAAKSSGQTDIHMNRQFVRKFLGMQAAMDYLGRVWSRPDVLAKQARGETTADVLELREAQMYWPHLSPQQLLKAIDERPIGDLLNSVSPLSPQELQQRGE